ncbi:MAG: hypothetical protein ACE5KZ_01035 [Candidatus Scalinduaceae bacterium]
MGKGTNRRKVPEGFGEEFWKGFWQTIQSVLEIIKILPLWQRLLGILAVFVFIIVIVSIIAIGDSTVVIVGLIIFGLLILVLGVASYFPIIRFKAVKKEMTKLPKNTISELLKGITINVSRILNIPNEKLRSNIFMLDENDYLKIPNGLHYNIGTPVELSIKIPPGYGSTGNAFLNKEPTIAILKEDWGKYILDDVEMQKVDKNLVWIVSMPIPSSGTLGEIIGVLNVDCLNLKKGRTDLERIVDDMWYWVNLISPLLLRKE